MIELNNLDVGLVDLTSDELVSIHGSDAFGAAIGGASGFSAAGVLSGGDLITAGKGGLAGTSIGNLIPVLTNPQVGVPTAFVLGTAAGVTQAVDSYNPFDGPFSFGSPTFGPSTFNTTTLR